MATSAPNSGNVAGAGALAGLKGSTAVGGVGATAGTPAYATGDFKWTVPGTPAQAPIPGSRMEAFARNIGQPPLPPQPGTYNYYNVGGTLASLDTNQFRVVQQQLYNIGAYPASYYGAKAKPVNWGKVGDLDTLQAFLGVAQVAGITGNLDQILSASMDVSALGEQGPTKEPLILELPSREDMDAVLWSAAEELMGAKPTAEQFARFAQKFSDSMAGYQRARYAAGGAGLPGGPGGTVTQPPNIQTAAQAFIREAAPVEVGAQSVEHSLGLLLRAFSSAGGPVGGGA